MRKLFALGAAMTLAAGALTGCGTASGTQKPTVVTTVYAVYDMAKQLTAEFENAPEVKLLLTPGGESHSYEPSPSDVAAIQSCDLFVYVGGESETWAEKLIETSRQTKKNVRLFDAVSPLTEETVEGMEAEHNHDDHDHDDHDDHDDEHNSHDHDHDGIEYDEHIWTSPLNADAMLKMTFEAIAVQYPAEKPHADAAYQKLHTAFTDLDAQAKQIKEKQKTNTLIFADRFPFRYLTNAYGWEYYAAFSGCSSDNDASAATLSFLISKVKDLDIKTVFYLENSTKKVSDAVCRATGADAVMLQSGNNVSQEDFKANLHYQDIMKANLDAIGKALGA
ncbi:MAG: zinc ABC transporter substrate-binding protein [Oscillospiraceae bacterium]|nr:zinc ABC transporter substrate-binding protein [Oscillospiraceae bacterium]